MIQPSLFLAIYLIIPKIPSNALKIIKGLGYIRNRRQEQGPDSECIH